jgi:hypothetical protein
MKSAHFDFCLLSHRLERRHIFLRALQIGALLLGSTITDAIKKKSSL